MKTVTISEAQTKLGKLIDEVNEFYHPIKITAKNGNAVLVPEKD